ncbi:MAG: AsmA family protein [Phenylobacterium sp.]|uniref:AsmA family protein n=1 Tax=Phenylobacterium sp. TaxID=1871053 RepID=UPI00391AC4A4
MRAFRPRVGRAGTWARERIAARVAKAPTPSETALVRAGAAAGVVALALIAFLAWFDWNMLRGPIARIASDRTGREVAIQGDLRVRLLSWEPSATVEGLRIGHPAWAGQGNTVDLARLHVQIRALPLLRGQVMIQRLELDRPTFVLIRDAQDRVTWDFSKDTRDEGEPFKMPPVRRFVIEDGRLRFQDAKRNIVLDATLDASERQGRANRGFQLAGKGSINDEAFLLEVSGGPLLNIDPGKPYPFDADIRAGATRVTAQGAIPRPFDLGRLGMDLTAQGPDLADLFPLTGVALPNTPPYRLTGRLGRNQRLWTLEGLNGRVGDSDLAGGLSVNTAGERPLLTADLRSRSLDFDDLAAVFGGAPKTTGSETASPRQQAIARQMAAQQRIFPDARLNVERIRAMDADVRYRAENVRDAMLPLRGAATHVKLENGLLTADPVRFELPQGAISGSARLDARRDTPVSSIDLRLANARLEQLITVSGTPLAGGLVGRIQLTGAGDSVHRAVSDADGQAVVVIPGGEIREAFAELLGINVVRGLGLLLSKDQSRTEIRCAVAHFQVRDGVLQAERIVFDTGPVLGAGSGSIDLGRERIALRIEGQPKEARLIRLMAPITLEGPIRSPKLGVEAGGAIAQGGIAAILGSAVAPLAAVLPFVDLGLAEDAACGALIAQARKEGAPAPRP